jgi:hypothetical protein
MHPYLTGLMAEAHRDDLLREADQHRLVVQVRAARPRRTLTPVLQAVAQLGAKARLLARPAPAAVAGCAPQRAAACC